MADRKQLNFTGLDTGAFTGKTRAAWDKLKKLQADAEAKIEPIMQPVNAQRETVEAEVTSALRAMGLIEKGQDVKFAYRFGGMAFAPIDAAESKSKSRKVVLQSGK